MTDTVERIKKLKEKKQKASLAEAKLNGQIEDLSKRRDELETTLKDSYGLTFDEVADHVKGIEQVQEEQLAEAEKLFDKVNL
jgi:hypothetical protein